ncbi:hypothetical protein HK104_002654 [Borealophlyctis nickersoniae]|nr:hypothetical protein HK104_002654 [Borealophlyctis nickersoniae]
MFAALLHVPTTSKEIVEHPLAERFCEYAKSHGDGILFEYITHYAKFKVKHQDSRVKTNSVSDFVTCMAENARLAGGAKELSMKSWSIRKRLISLDRNKSQQRDRVLLCELDDIEGAAWAEIRANTIGPVCDEETKKALDQYGPRQRANGYSRQKVLELNNTVSSLRARESDLSEQLASTRVLSEERTAALQQQLRQAYHEKKYYLDLARQFQQEQVTNRAELGRVREALQRLRDTFTQMEAQMGAQREGEVGLYEIESSVNPVAIVEAFEALYSKIHSQLHKLSPPFENHPALRLWDELCPDNIGRLKKTHYVCALESFIYDCLVESEPDLSGLGFGGLEESMEFLWEDGERDPTGEMGRLVALYRREMWKKLNRQYNLRELPESIRSKLRMQEEITLSSILQLFPDSEKDRHRWQEIVYEFIGLALRCKAAGVVCWMPPPSWVTNSSDNGLDAEPMNVDDTAWSEEGAKAEGASEKGASDGSVETDETWQNVTKPEPAVLFCRELMETASSCHEKTDYRFAFCPGLYNDRTILAKAKVASSSWDTELQNRVLVLEALQPDRYPQTVPSLLSNLTLRPCFYEFLSETGNTFLLQYIWLCYEIQQIAGHCVGRDCVQGLSDKFRQIQRFGPAFSSSSTLLRGQLVEYLNDPRFMTQTTLDDVRAFTRFVPRVDQLLEELRDQFRVLKQDQIVSKLLNCGRRWYPLEGKTDNNYGSESPASDATPERKVQQRCVSANSSGGVINEALVVELADLREAYAFQHREQEDAIRNNGALISQIAQLQSDNEILKGQLAESQHCFAKLKENVKSADDELIRLRGEIAQLESERGAVQGDVGLYELESRYNLTSIVEEFEQLYADMHREVVSLIPKDFETRIEMEQAKRYFGLLCPDATYSLKKMHLVYAIEYALSEAIHWGFTQRLSKSNFFGSLEPILQVLCPEGSTNTHLDSSCKKFTRVLWRNFSEHIDGEVHEELRSEWLWVRLCSMSVADAMHKIAPSSPSGYKFIMVWHHLAGRILRFRLRCAAVGVKLYFPAPAAPHDMLREQLAESGLQTSCWLLSWQNTISLRLFPGPGQRSHSVVPMPGVVRVDGAQKTCGIIKICVISEPGLEEQVVRKHMRSPGVSKT